MICYMPFTDVDQRTLELLSKAMGAITVFSPAPSLVPGHLEPWSRQGLLEIRHPSGVDEYQLLGAIQAYKAWADLHQGNIGDLAGFFKAQQGRFPLVEETHPTQIGDQIRHYGESSSGDAADAVFRAALFLAMAHEYDQHHHAMHRDMDAVHAMERQMLEQLSGDGRQDPSDTALIDAPLGEAPKDQTFEAYMIPQRVVAWARIVLSQAPLPLIYLTTSSAAFEHAMDRFPQAVEMAAQSLPGSQGDAPASSSTFLKTIKALAYKADLRSQELDETIHAGDRAGHAQLALFALPGVTPYRFLTALSTSQPPSREAPAKLADGPRHTFVGLVKTPRHKMAAS